MNEPTRFSTVLRQPTAYLPIVMSLAALSVVVLHVARFGTARQPDEGADVHLWQLLMAGQIPVILAFAVQWLPRSPRPALAVLALQLAAAAAAVVPVLVLER